MNPKMMKDWVEQYQFQNRYSHGRIKEYIPEGNNLIMEKKTGEKKKKLKWFVGVNFPLYFFLFNVGNGSSTQINK